MSTLQDKYASVIAAAQNAGISHLRVAEQNGILYVAGYAANSAAKDAVWNALGTIDSTYSASDINLDVQINGLASGSTLTVNTESSNLNIRQQPSTDAAVIGKAAKGETVTLVEQTSDEWWKVRTSDGEEGYAYARYLHS